MTRVLVTGVRAKTGEPLARLLSEKPNLEIRGGSTNPTSIDLPGVEPVRFSWDEPTTWKPATDGVDAIFVVRPDRIEAPQLISDLLAATSPGAHVVLLSELDGGYFKSDDWAPQVEHAVRDSNRTWTFLRPTWFMQIFTDERFLIGDVREGRLPFPSGGQPVAWIDTRDIAAVGAHALLDPKLHDQTLDLTGPAALTLADTAAALGDALGRPVEHEELTLDQALSGSEGFERDNDFGAFDRIHRGMAGVVTNTVPQVLSRPATPFAEFAADVFAPAALR